MLLHVKTIIFYYVYVCLLYVCVLCQPPSSGILSDLFPGVSIPDHDYGVLHTTILESLVKRNLQPLASMTKKVQGGKSDIPYLFIFISLWIFLAL